MSNITNPELVKKWADILNHPDLPVIEDKHRRAVTARLLENQAVASANTAMALDEAVPVNFGGTGIALGGAGTNSNMAGYDPVLIAMVRRAAPLMIAYDACGVQPMTQPTGLIFAMKAKYTNQSGTEALFNEADTGFSGTGTHAGSNPVDGTYTTGTGMTTATSEGLGDVTPFKQMAFSIEKTSVTAQARSLRAEYTTELAQDLKAVHGLDADVELSNILTSEVLNEINREVLRTIYTCARTGAQAGTATAGTFDLDVDSNGRWSVEKFKGLMFQIEREANAVGETTRRGRGNILMCSADVASALAMAGVLDYAPALNGNSAMNIDTTSSTYAGVLNGKYKVYVDPYSANANATNATQFFVIGYKGSSAYDAGVFYCPYVALEKFKAQDPNTFQPKIGFKTRYGIVANPFTSLASGQNIYYRKVAVTNLM